MINSATEFLLVSQNNQSQQHKNLSFIRLQSLILSLLLLVNKQECLNVGGRLLLLCGEGLSNQVVTLASVTVKGSGAVSGAVTQSDSDPPTASG